MGSSKRCQVCYNILQSGTEDYHLCCKTQILGVNFPSILPFNLKDIEDYGKTSLSKSVIVTGVQPKLPMMFEVVDENTKLPRAIYHGSQFIIKTPIDYYPEICELEDLTMHLASLNGIQTAEHCLIRMYSGEFAYITKRFDRMNGKKLPLEDMAQLTGTLAENKYRSSMERVGKIIIKYSNSSREDLHSLLDLTIFSFLTGNSDMHLKNFSLLTTSTNRVRLSPAYDLVPFTLLIPRDPEEMALALRGKKNRLRRKDFFVFATTIGLNQESVIDAIQRFEGKLGDMQQLISISFLKEETKERYIRLIEERYQRLVHQS